MANYFVKNDKLHKDPPENGCSAKKDANSKTYNSPPQGYEKCDRCFNLPR
jgi:hypothetical protein